MLGVHPRLSQLLVTHLKELKAESLLYASGEVVMEEQEHANDILLPAAAQWGAEC
jgi:hypothetical protein